MAEGPPSAVGPLDVLTAGRHRFLHGERVDMGDLAVELGISRATLYRWVGGREQLLGEVLWSLAQVGIRESREAAAGQRGTERVARFWEHFVRLTAGSEPIRRFIAAERESALRSLTSRHGVQQRRLIDALRDYLVEQAAAGEIVLRREPADLAYAMTRIGESFMWREFITGEEPDLDGAVAVVRVLLEGATGGASGAHAPSA